MGNPQGVEEKSAPWDRLIRMLTGGLPLVTVIGIGCYRLGLECFQMIGYRHFRTECPDEKISFRNLLDRSAFLVIQPKDGDILLAACPFGKARWSRLFRRTAFFPADPIRFPSTTEREEGAAPAEDREPSLRAAYVSSSFFTFPSYCLFLMHYFIKIFSIQWKQ